MKTNMMPFNLSLLLLTDNDVKGMRPVKVLDIFDGVSRNFHPDGLFSVETFGKVGEEKRNRMFSYIDLKVPIFHPQIFKSLLDLKGLYGDIMAGRAYAVFNKDTKDFDKSTITEGQTGFSFFMKHFKELKFEERPSAERQFNIKLVEKHRANPMFDKLVVMPAGMRDYVIDENGKPSEDEVNSFYRKILSIADMLQNVNIELNAAYLDSSRYNLQSKVLELYQYIFSLLEGKKKLVLGKFATRAVSNSTRNVITSFIPEVTELHGDKTVSSRHTVVGLHQFMRAAMPIKQIRDTFLADVFPGPNSPAVLVNTKTLKKELVKVSPEHYDEWMTYEGIEKIMARFGIEDLRHSEIMIEGYYLGLIYKGPDMTFRIFQDIDDLPESFDKKNVTPLTMAELLYISVYKEAGDVPSLVTRYPITGYGSIYPSYSYLKTTVRSEVRIELNEMWQPSDHKAQEFPITGLQFYNSFSPSSTNLARLGADFDGDCCSFTAVWTDDAKEEIKNLLNSKDYYLDINNNMNFSMADDIINLMLLSMTS